jgi:hypothetical protein
MTGTGKTKRKRTDAYIPRWLADSAIASACIATSVKLALDAVAADNPDLASCAQPELIAHARKLIEAVQANRRDAVPVSAKVLPLKPKGKKK